MFLLLHRLLKCYKSICDVGEKEYPFFLYRKNIQISYCNSFKNVEFFAKYFIHSLNFTSFFFSMSFSNEVDLLKFYYYVSLSNIILLFKQFIFYLVFKNITLNKMIVSCIFDILQQFHKSWLFRRKLFAWFCFEGSLFQHDSYCQLHD